MTIYGCPKIISINGIRSPMAESLHETFYTKKVILEGIGKKVSIVAWIGEDGSVTYQALLSKNTIPHEKPYRISWFELNTLSPKGHVDMNRFQFNKLMRGEQDSDVAMKVSQFIEADRIHLNLDDQQQLDEGINGHKITVNYYGKQMPAVLSKNTIPGEKPYRVSFFDILKGHVEARGHFDLTKQEAEEVLQNRKFPDEVIVIYKGISVRNIDGWPKINDVDLVSHITPSKGNWTKVNENLLLLEESSREIDLWLENKI
jgi:hypothetical protein